MACHSSSKYLHFITNSYVFQSSHEYIFSPYSHANLIVNEPNTHDEPYGYEVGDDPFDTHGHGD